jgi:hypothetical protein
MYVLSFDQVVTAFPYSVEDLRRDNANTSFPAEMTEEMLAAWNVYPVAAQPVPAHDQATQNVKQIAPTLVGNKWLQTWEVTDASSEEIAKRLKNKEAEVRDDRNKRLSDCDWTQLPDAPVDHTEWAAYRQALRDVTAQAGFPWSIEWPQQP